MGFFAFADTQQKPVLMRVRSLPASEISYFFQTEVSAMSPVSPEAESENFFSFPRIAELEAYRLAAEIALSPRT